MIEKIIYNDILLSIIIRSSFQRDGIEFFTNDSDSQQIGYMKRPKDYFIEPHRHNVVKREVGLTQEVLFLRKGSIRVDFYDNEQQYLESKILYTGDVILLSNGGHGFYMLEDSELIEVKQGPYVGMKDKVRFSAIDPNNIIYK